MDLLEFDVIKINRENFLLIWNKCLNLDSMDINIQNKKIELIQWLSTLNDESMIEKLIKLREKEKSDWWNELSKAEKESIEKGLLDAENGKLITHSTAKKAYEKWL